MTKKIMTQLVCGCCGHAVDIDSKFTSYEFWCDKCQSPVINNKFKNCSEIRSPHENIMTTMELVLLIQEYENVYGIIVDDFFKLPFLSTYDAIVHKKSFSSWLDFISSVIIVFGSWVGVTLAFYFLGLGLIIAIIIGFIVWILFLIIYIVIAYRIVYRKYTRPVINGVINFVCGEENNYESIETILSSSISDNNKNEILTEFIESSRIPIRIRNSAICAIWFLQQKTEQQNARCEDKLTSDITWSKIKCNHIVPIGPPDLRNAVIQKYHDDRRN